MLKDFFSESLFTIQYIFKNKNKTISLANIYATRYSLINKKFIKEIVC